MSDDLGEWKDLYNKGLINDDELLARPFNATVVKRLKIDPEYKDELLKEIIELIQIGELKTAQVLLNEIIEVEK
jgi:hypothetical protein